jgi:glycosyltransferase involved in cell wall biosynthesis
MVEPFFSIRDKPSFYSPHPSYLGAYPNTITREEARFHFGFCPDTTVFLCFGKILLYKGIEDLLSSLQVLVRDSQQLDWKLVIAGGTLDGDLVRRLRGFDGLDGRVLINSNRVPIQDVEYFFTAADYCILPYRRSLNSGVAMLAMSFGVPVIAPATATFKEPLSRGTGLGYRAEDEGALASALKTAIGADRSAMRASAVAFAHERRAENASAAFFQGLTARLASLDRA